MVLPRQLPPVQFADRIKIMDHRKIAYILEEHLKRIEETAEGLYKKRLMATITDLNSGEYREREHELIRHLTNLGFHDLAKKVRMGMYI
jgi:hypothetical protein